MKRIWLLSKGRQVMIEIKYDFNSSPGKDGPSILLSKIQQTACKVFGFSRCRLYVKHSPLKHQQQNTISHTHVDETTILSQLQNTTTTADNYTYHEFLVEEVV